MSTCTFREFTKKELAELKEERKVQRDLFKLKEKHGKKKSWKKHLEHQLWLTTISDFENTRMLGDAMQYLIDLHHEEPNNPVFDTYSRQKEKNERT